MERAAVVLGYVRTEPDGQEEPGRSAALQQAAVEGYARLRGLTLTEVLQDEGIPSSAPLEVRPGGGRLIERLRDARGAQLLVTTLDRLFCGASECLGWLEDWRARAVGVHVLDLGGAAYDLSGAAAGPVLATLAAVRDMEGGLAGGAVDGLAGRRAGRSERPLLGEKVVRGYIVPDLDELQAVQRIRELHDEGKSLKQIADALDGEGIPTKRRARAWSKEAIRLILRRIEVGDVRSLRASRPDNRPPH